MRTGKIHYAWFVLVACLGFYSLLIGVFASTQGVFYAPVMEETGWSRTTATLFTSIQPIVSAVCSLFSARILARYNPRWVLSACVVAFGVAYAAPAFCNELWVWNLYGAVFGICASFVLYLAVPTLVNRWFAKRVGFAIGVASSGISVFAAIGNPIVAQLIADFGWRTARVQTGAAVTIAAFLLTALLVRSRPEDLGLLPYGAQSSVRPPQNLRDGDAHASPRVGGATFSQAVRSPAFGLILCAIGLFVIGTTLVQQLPSYGAESPLGAQAGALAVSIVSTVAVFAKVFLGWMNDRTGIIRVTVLACICGIVGALGMLLAGDAQLAFFVAAGVFGVGYSSLTIISPLSVREAFGLADYTRIYARITTVVFILNALGNLVYAVIYDCSGSYSGMFVLAGGLYATALIVLPAGVRIGRRLWTSHT